MIIAINLIIHKYTSFGEKVNSTLKYCMMVEFKGETSSHQITKRTHQRTVTAECQKKIKENIKV